MAGDAPARANQRTRLQRELRWRELARTVEALAIARTALRSSAVYPQVHKEIGPEHAEAVTILLFAIADRLKASQRDELGTLNGPITEEVDNLRAQLAALLGIQDTATSTLG